jgi:hypothetical protein
MNNLESTKVIYLTVEFINLFQEKASSLKEKLHELSLRELMLRHRATKGTSKRPFSSVKRRIVSYLL